MMRRRPFTPEDCAEMSRRYIVAPLVMLAIALVVGFAVPMFRDAPAPQAAESPAAPPAGPATTHPAPTGA